MLTDARFKFALESLKKCMMMESKTSVFFSPHLIYQNLLVVYFGVENNETENSLRQILCIPDDVSKAVVQQYYFFGGVSQFCYIENGPAKSYTCRIYSRVLISDSKILYIETMNLFSSSHQVKEISFKIRPDLIRNFINNTITCITQRCIKNMLPPNDINDTTEIVLWNVIYCKGELDGSFDFDMNDRKNTRKNILRHRSKSKKFNNDKFKQLDAYIMEIPCKQKKISTFFLFPSHNLESDKNETETDRIIKLIEQMTTEKGSQELREILDNGISQETNMIFPIFKIEQDLPMYELLDMLGIRELTPFGTVELHEFTCKGLKLGGSMHRVYINVTLNDITATASDIFFTDTFYEHVRKDTTVDVLFPCICLIYDRSHRNILFCGVLLDS